MEKVRKNNYFVKTLMAICLIITSAFMFCGCNDL